MQGDVEIMLQLQEKYHKEIVPQLIKELGYTNMFEVPRIQKITLNIGTSKARDNSKLQETMEQTLARISGQTPVKTRSRKSISSFKVREGQVVGLKVTLRGKRMYDFLNKCIHVTLPRIRDFQGISPNSFDPSGKSFTIGFKEHISFPEVKGDEVEKIHGLEMTITIDSKGKKESLALLRHFGIPFRSDEQEKEYQEALKRAREEKKERERARKRMAEQARATQELVAAQTEEGPAEHSNEKD